MSNRTRQACDYAVVGSGAAGSIAAWALTEAGFEVTTLEEGPPLDRSVSSQGVGVTLARYFREGGTQVAEGRAFLPLLQGRCLGGGTAINSAICWRVPEDAYERTFGRVKELVPMEALEAGFAEIERRINIHPVEEPAFGRNNALLRDGSRRLGWDGRVIPRNERDCQGSSQCMQGCPSGRKLSADRTWIPWAQGKGMQLHTGWEVVRVWARTGGNPPRLLARASRDGGQTGELEIEARKGIILAASAVQTPLILQRSGLGNTHVGRHFRGHPGAALLALYDTPVRSWEGATQGYEVTHFRRDRHFKIESLALPPELGAARVPGVGNRLIREFARLGYTSNWGVEVCAEAEGTVRPRALFGGAKISYSMLPSDMTVARAGLRTMAEIAFAAGAKAVIPAVYGLPEQLTSPDQLHLIDQASIDPRHWTMIVSHLFGTCRLHADPREGAVGRRFEVHGAPGIHALDASIFPSNIGVNPQHTIMSVALHAARTLAFG